MVVAQGDRELTPPVPHDAVDTFPVASVTRHLPALDRPGIQSCAVVEDVLM